MKYLSTSSEKTSFKKPLYESVFPAVFFFDHTLSTGERSLSLNIQGGRNQALALISPNLVMDLKILLCIDIL